MREDADCIKMDLDSLLNDGDITEESIESIKDSIDELVEDYEEQISDLEDELNIRDEQVCTLESMDLEDYAGHILQSFSGTEPNLGETLALKEDLEKLLTTKYHISLGNL